MCPWLSLRNNSNCTTTENRIEGILDGEIQASVISRDDLIRNKLATGREQDILDAKNLRSAGTNDPK